MIGDLRTDIAKNNKFESFGLNLIGQLSHSTAVLPTPCMLLFAHPGYVLNALAAYALVSRVYRVEMPTARQLMPCPNQEHEVAVCQLRQRFRYAIHLPSTDCRLLLSRAAHGESKWSAIGVNRDSTYVTHFMR